MEQTPITGTDDQITTFNAASTTARQLCALATSIAEAGITDDRGLGGAVDLRGTIRRGMAQLEAVRTDLVKPLNDHVRNINARFKPLAAGLEEALGKLDRAILDFRAAQELARKAAAEAARKAAEEADRKAAAAALETATATRDEALAAGFTEAEAEALAVITAGETIEAQAKATPPAPAPPAPTPLIGAREAATIRRTWAFEVVAAAEVPRVYTNEQGISYILLTINETAVRAAIRDGARSIPGLRIYQAETVVGR